MTRLTCSLEPAGWRMHLVCRTFSRWWEDEMESVSHSVVSDSATPWTVARQAPLSMGFPRQESWSGLPFPSPGDLPDEGSSLGLLHYRQILHCLSHQRRFGQSLWEHFAHVVS